MRCLSQITALLTANCKWFWLLRAPVDPVGPAYMYMYLTLWNAFVIHMESGISFVLSELQDVARKKYS